MIEHHFISPHRDDGFLTFGGYILSRRELGEPVFMHVIYGLDGYMREDFKDQLFSQGCKNPHVSRLGEILYSSPFLESSLNKIQILSQKKSRSEVENLQLGILVRTLEDRAIAHLGGYTLVEYHFPCGYPLRGYPEYNSPLNLDDFIEQSHKHLDIGADLTNDYRMANLLGISNPNISPFRHKIQAKQQVDKEIKTQLYFPSGIGGHPDHLILSSIGFKMYLENPASTDIRFGQDLPYATVPEWFQKSNLPFDNLPKKVMDITNFRSKKAALFALYKSQLSEEDIRLLNQYPFYTCSMLHQQYYSEQLNQINNTTFEAVEIQYG